MDPQVSIIITTYNYGTFIKDTLQSILIQSFSDYEVIIVDDGSTDNTAGIIEALTASFNGKLRYFFKNNQGVALARNYGIQKSRGEYIVFIDADDIWLEGALQKLVSCMSGSPGCGLAYGNVKFYDIALEQSIGLRFHPGLTSVPYNGKCFDKLFIHGNFIHTSACIVRRSIFEQVGLFDRRFKCGEDLDMWIRVSAVFEIKYIDEVLTKVRRHTNSLTFEFLSSNKSMVLMTRKMLKSIPHFENTIGREQIKNKLYEAYYAIGIYSILDGKNKKGRLWLQKAWKINPGPFNNKIIFYLILSFLPFSVLFKKIRGSPSIRLGEKQPQKIKVLHIIKTLNLGGAESNLLNLVRSFDDSSFEIHVAYSSQGELEGTFKESKVKLFKYSDHPHKLKSFATIGIILRLVNYIKKEHIKIVHTHSFNAHIWGGIAAKLAACKIIEHVHDSRYIDPQEFEKRGEKNQQYKFIRFLKNFSDRVIVLTKQNQDFVIKHRLYRPGMVQEIQNGIDLKAAKDLSNAERINLKQKLHLPLDENIVLTPIRFSPEKNLNVLFQIAAEVTTTLSQVIFVIAGTGPEKEKFENRVKSYGLQDRIRAIGFYPDIPELLAISDVFLLPSTIELHSIAIMEAMRQKVPVVVSKNVGCNDKFIRHWENGILLDPFTKKGWSDAIITLLQDSDLRRHIGEAGFQTLVQEFDIKDVAKKFEHIYESLLLV